MQSSDPTLSTARLSRATDDIWVVDDAPISATGLKLPVRMTVIRLSNGDLVLHSPVRYSPALRGELERLGAIKYLLAPNIAHWMFLSEWQRELPQVTTFAARALRRAGKFEQHASVSTERSETRRLRNGGPTSKPSR